MFKLVNKKMITPGFPQALEIMKTWKITKTSSMHGKIMEFEKKNE